MKLEEFIGARVREARNEKGWTQAVLGMHLVGILGGPWTAQAVSAAENGRRDFRAADLFALAVALRRPVEWFLPGEERVELPGSFVSKSHKGWQVEFKSTEQTASLIQAWQRTLAEEPE